MYKLILFATIIMFHNLSYSASCPGNDLQWSQFRDDSAALIAKKNMDSGDDSVFNLASFFRDLAQTLQTCESPLDSSLKTSLTPLQNFANSRKNSGRDGWDLGFNVNDATYFNETALILRIEK